MPDDRRWWTLAVLCLSLLMVIMGNTVLNIALPRLVVDLRATNSQLQWMVDAYSLVFAGLLFTSGALGDRFGRKGALQIGLVVFGTGSALAALSTRPWQIIACRALMGAGASLVMPSTLSILTNVFPRHERARAIGIWAGVAGAGGAIGPVTSGWLLEHFWWGSVFFLNIPVVILALVAGKFLVPTSKDPRDVPLDLVGAGMSILAVSSLVYGIIEAPQRGWTDSRIVGSFAVSAVVFLAFAAWELRVEHPMLDLRFFKRRGFSGGAIAISMVFFGMFGMFFLLTQYLQLVRGYNPLQTGIRTLPFAATMMIAAPSSARVAERIGTKATVTLGLIVAGTGQFIMSRNGVDTPYLLLALSFVVLATGMGLTMAPSTAAIMSSLPLAKSGVGSAMNDTTRELGGALGVAVLGSLVASRYAHALDRSIAALPASAKATARSSLGGAIGVAHGIGGLPSVPQLADAARHAFADAMSHTLIIGGLVAYVAAALVSWIMPDQLGDSEAQLAEGGLEVDEPVGSPLA
ncbi:MAG: drug resistance transporter, EmrB/QacA subfamily [Acidimicrobiales bacterium]|nr:drug resistance transporter, EmrB/QacA subfamily [Acidimicrobiales bacterium]